MTVADEIEKLHQLRQSGALSEAEFESAKKALLEPSKPPEDAFSKAVNRMASDVNTWCMFIHLSQFCGFVIPGAGFVVPIVLWQTKKNESPLIDRHGRIVANWMLTELILSVVCIPLCFILIGIPLLIGLAVAGVVFAILGAVKAYDGIVWPYPFSFRFFRAE